MISRNEVPKYLQNGSFFQTLNVSDDEKFEVPSDCLKTDLTIESDQDLRHVLRSIRFWGVYDMPGEILRYAVKSAEKTYLEELVTEFTETETDLVTEFPEFKEYIGKIIALKACQPKQAISLALEFQLGTEVVRFLHDEMCCPIVQDQFVVAVRHDDLPSLLFFFEEMPNIASQHNKTMIATAVDRGSIMVLQHAQKEGWTFDNHHLLAAVSGGNVEVVKFLHDECSTEYSTETMKHAAVLDAGNLEMVRYLHESGCPWDEDVCAAFASKNLLDCLTFAHEQGCPWDERTCIGAAGEGHLRCLQYAHLQGCPWNDAAALSAVAGNHLDCLMYVDQQISPLDNNVSKSALLSGSWECLWYALCAGAICEDMVSLIGTMLFLVVVLGVKLYYWNVEWESLNWTIVSYVCQLLRAAMVVTELLITKHLHPAVNVLRYVFSAISTLIDTVTTVCELVNWMGLIVG